MTLCIKLDVVRIIMNYKNYYYKKVKKSEYVAELNYIKTDFLQNVIIFEKVKMHNIEYR